MISDCYMICNDFLAYATLLPARGRTKFLQAALSYLRDGREQLPQPKHLLAKPAILSIQACLKFDSWGLYPQCGDPSLSFDEYLGNKSSLIYNEIRSTESPGFPMLNLTPVHAACRDIWSRHGLKAVLPFLKSCWKDGLVLSLDDFFWVMHTAVRSEAFGMEWDYCWEELLEAESKAAKDSTGSDVTMIGRARQLAEIDARKARDCKSLETIARREQQSVNEALGEARLRPFSSFLREIYALKPIYYTLRDIWYELHFLASDPRDRSEFEYLECWADEMQTDIGQMVLYPTSGPMLVDMSDLNGRSVAHCHRWVNFWEHSRVQFNRAIAHNIRANLNTLSGRVDADALKHKLQTLLTTSLSEGQRLAFVMFKVEIDQITTIRSE